jgi:hypothetical protein
MNEIISDVDPDSELTVFDLDLELDSTLAKSPRIITGSNLIVFTMKKY